MNPSVRVCDVIVFPGLALLLILVLSSVKTPEQCDDEFCKISGGATIGTCIIACVALATAYTMHRYNTIHYRKKEKAQAETEAQVTSRLVLDLSAQVLDLTTRLGNVEDKLAGCMLAVQSGAQIRDGQSEVFNKELAELRQAMFRTSQSLARMIADHIKKDHAEPEPQVVTTSGESSDDVGASEKIGHSFSDAPE